MQARDLGVSIRPSDFHAAGDLQANDGAGADLLATDGDQLRIRFLQDPHGRSAFLRFLHTKTFSFYARPLPLPSPGWTHPFPFPAVHQGHCGHRPDKEEHTGDVERHVEPGPEGLGFATLTTLVAILAMAAFLLCSAPETAAPPTRTTTDHVMEDEALEVRRYAGAPSAAPPAGRSVWSSRWTPTPPRRTRRPSPNSCW